MAIEIVDFILALFKTAFAWIFTLEITEGVSIGWILIVVIIMSILIKFFLKNGGSDNG